MQADAGLSDVAQAGGVMRHLNVLHPSYPPAAHSLTASQSMPGEVELDPAAVAM